MATQNRNFVQRLLLIGTGSAIACGAFYLLLGHASRLKAEAPTMDSDQVLLTQAARQLEQFCRSLPASSPKVSEPSAEQPATADQASAKTSESSNAPITAPCDNFWASVNLIQPKPVSLLTAPSTQLNQLTKFWSWFSPQKSEATPADSTPPETQIILPPTASFPNLNTQARVAAVPILMYHDILPTKEVSWDVTPEELEAHFKRIQALGLTPITADQLLLHLRTGVPLPDKPVLLSFDDGYGGHYQYVFPLLKKYNYPALFSIYLTKMEAKTKRTSVTWDQLKEMAASPLITIASHTIKHSRDLRELSDDELSQEIIHSKHLLEEKLGIPINYFTYPEGKYDARVKQWAIAAGYKMAFSMDDTDEGYAGESPDLFSIKRFGQSNFEKAVANVWGGYPAPIAQEQFNFVSPVQKRDFTEDDHAITLVWGGKPKTLHADSHYQVAEILEGTGAVAGVDGTFFSLESLTSNTLIGPVFSSNRGFVPGNKGENPLLAGRPLVLISSSGVRFIPFDPDPHNSLAGIQKESKDGRWISDAFVAGAWLVRDGKPSTPESFNGLYGFDANRNRAFWGINQAGQPVLGVSHTLVDSIKLGQILVKLGLRDVVMVDSGASASLAFYGQSQMKYPPRPTPHAIALFAPSQPQGPEPKLDKTVALNQ